MKVTISGWAEAVSRGGACSWGREREVGPRPGYDKEYARALVGFRSNCCWRCQNSNGAAT